MMAKAKKTYLLKMDHERCKGCGLCVDFCPKDVLALTTDKLNAKGLTYACCIEPENCIGCMSCTMICPDTAIEISEEVDD